MSMLVYQAVIQGGLQNEALTEQFSDLKCLDLGAKIGDSNYISVVDFLDHNLLLSKKKSYQDLSNEGSTTPSDNFWLCQKNLLYSFGFVQGPCWHFALNFPLCNKNLNSFLTSQPFVPEVFGLEFPCNPRPLWPFGYQPQIRFQQMQTWRIKNTKINYYKI